MDKATVAARPAARNAARNTRRTHRNGMSLVAGTAMLTVLMGFASFTVDFGRLQLAKAELRRAADAAARVGAGSLALTTAQARADARAWAKRNAVDGRPLTDGGIVVTVGRWDTAKRTFTAMTGNGTGNGNGQSPNAVRVVLSRPAAGAESVPMIWGRVINATGVRVEAEAIAQYVPGINVNHQVDGTANPFLSGITKGGIASPINPKNNPDYAGDADSSDLAKRRQSPTIVPLSVRPGDVIQFDEPVTGTVRHDPNLPFFGPDGELADIGHNNVTKSHGSSKGARMYSENGIADMWAPINALAGVFTGDADPRHSATPDSLDFRDAASRDFAQLQPKPKQIFFIGDGMNGAGMRQSFVVPEGATKLYLATWDFYEWNNNLGSRTIKINRPARIITVK